MTIVHWDNYAHTWQHVKPPLRPSQQDLEVMLTAIKQQQTIVSPKKSQAVLLGITPEIAEMQWPDNSELLAFERSAGMKQVNWPGDISGKRHAYTGNWLELTVNTNQADIVIGDGSFNCVAFADEFEKVTQEIDRVLNENGVLIMRFFKENIPHVIII